MTAGASFLRWLADAEEHLLGATSLSTAARLMEEGHIINPNYETHDGEEE